MAIKEIWVYLLAYNLIRLMMAQAALLADRLPRRFSFKHTVQLWIAWDRHANGTAPTSANMATPKSLSKCHSALAPLACVRVRV